MVTNLTVRRNRKRRADVRWLMAACAVACFAGPADAASLLIRNVRVADGSGAAIRAGAVRIDGDRIVAVGKLKARKGEAVVDGGGQVLAPGFIDAHSHADWALPAQPEAAELVSQGVTTIITGQDGASRTPLGKYFASVDAKPGSVNVASFSGHNSIRAKVMGSDFKREATPAEVEAMARLVHQDMAAGAIGLSTGLEYDPGIYSSQAEVLALAKQSAADGGRYISHIRSEDRAVWAALDEVVAIGRATGAPVQVSHMKLAMTDWWGQASRYLKVLDSARAEGIQITGDVYPYNAWLSTPTVLFSDRVFSLAHAQFALDHFAPADGVVIAGFPPDPKLVGQTLAAIATARGTTPAETLLALIKESGGQASTASVMARSMSDDDVAKLVSWPYASISSDGQLKGRHPRGAGAFTRVLRVHVRERHDLTLAEAIRKMTSLTAAQMNLADRGVIRPGAYADLVLFDPATVSDHADTAHPNALSTGVSSVWVNGEVVFEQGRTTGRHPGRALRRGQKAQ